MLTTGANPIKLNARNLDFCKKLVFVPKKPFQSSLMFAVKARGLPQSGTPERSFNGGGSGLTCKH